MAIKPNPATSLNAPQPTHTVLPAPNPLCYTMMRRSERSSSPLLLAGGAVLATVLLAALMPMAQAGAVFEEKKPILPNPADYKILFNLPAPLPPGTPGTVTFSSTPFNKTSIPLGLFTLEKCAVLSIHFHPLGTETLFIIQGAVEVGLFSEDNSFKVVTVKAGEAVLIPQGVVHYVRNVDSHKASTYLQISDHPLVGIQFLGSALLAMPKDVLASAFYGGGLPSKTTGPIFKLKGCY